ncbi:hypothetical protein [Methylibium petroleiphilum]|nr:hypothetical protein [Methylibium petroleiphilum]
MVIDQAREILAAAEGHRNWHAMLASLGQQPAGSVQAAASHVESASATMLQALELVSSVLDRLAHGADFDRVVDETGVTHQVLTAIREAKTGQKDGAAIQGQPTYDQLYKTLFALGSQNPIWTKQPNIDVIVNEWLQSARDVLGMELNASGDLVAKSEADQPKDDADDNGLTAAQRREAGQQGWNLFDADGVELQIQREDDSMVFPGDDEAWLFVIREAVRNPASAAAKALALVRERSPAEYARIESFDRNNEQLLVKGPKASTGHPVDLAEVAEWVGAHYKVNFDTVGERQQEWIDRFALAHANEDRFANYLVAHGWEHIFIGKTRSETRWVFRLGGDDEGVIHAQIRNELGGWVDLDRVAMDDLEESIYDNSVPDDYQTWAPEVQLTLRLPNWAAPGGVKKQRDTSEGWFDVEGYSTKARWEGPESNDGGLDGFTTLEAAKAYAAGSAMDGFYEVVVTAYGQHVDYEPGERVWARHNRPYAGDGNEDSFTEILQHRVRWHLRGDGAPSALNESAEEHVEHLIRNGFNQGELLVTSDDGEAEFRGWWSIDKS